MNTTTFPQLVIDEATNLKIHTTVEEKADLNFETFDPKRPAYCVYGQLTGSCFSKRAAQLIELCAERVYIAEDNLQPMDCQKLNGKPQPGDRTSIRTEYWSPIEVFIQLAEPEMNEKLLQYIKGDINTLE